MEIIEAAALIAGILAVLAWVSSTVTALTVRRIYAQIAPLLVDVAGARAALAEVRALIAEARPALALVAEVRPLLAEARPALARIVEIAEDPTAHLIAGLDAHMADAEGRAALEQRLQWLGRHVASGAVRYVREQAGRAEAQQTGAQTGGLGGGILGMLIQGLLPRQYRGIIGALGGGGAPAPAPAYDPSDPYGDRR